MKRFNFLAVLGPGIVLAATGLGAGDLITATVSGKQLGIAIIWAILVGAVIKFVLNEALARWQLVTGETLLESWCTRLPNWFSFVFFFYLILWATLVSAALMAACGLAAHALFPVLPVNVWAAIHSLVAALLVIFGRYSLIEKTMKGMIVLMFATVLSAVLTMDLSSSFSLSMADLRGSMQSLPLVLSVIGGVGGSVTLLCYSYWMKEKGWNSRQQVTLVRRDLAAGYTLTALFGVCIVVLAAEIQPDLSKGSQVIVDLADAIGTQLGELFRWLFLLGFWGAIASSMLGVWQGIPYLFSDFIVTQNVVFKGADGATENATTSTRLYNGFLIYISSFPIILLWFGKPVWLVLIYSIAGAFFMPILALTLIYLQKKYLQTDSHTIGLSQASIAISLIFFVFLAVVQYI